MQRDPRRPPISDRLLDLVERHGEGYLREGRRLLRRLGLALLLAGIGVLAAGLAVAVLVGNAVFHWVR